MDKFHRRWHLGHVLGIALFIFTGLGLKLADELPQKGWRDTAGLAVLLVGWQIVAYAYERGARDALRSTGSSSH